MFEKKLLAKRQEPFNLLRQMTTELDRMFDEPWMFFGPADLTLTNGAAWAPKVDVVTKDNQMITRVDLPGMAKEDVLVQVEDGMLTLSGERKKETRDEQGDVYREEREYGSFSRTFPLPKGARAEDVKAKFANGVLEVTVPIPAAAIEPKAKKIAIADGGAKAA